jgi:hypothetical protein
MQRVSAKYKEIMDRPLRNRGYMAVSVGVVNQEAQASGDFTGEYEPWSDMIAPFGNDVQDVKYVTMEQNYFRVDGSMFFLPEGELAQYRKGTGVIATDVLGVVTITFPVRFAIKGLTIDFEEWCYPTRFTVQTEEKILKYSNTEKRFETTDVLGETNYIKIIPTVMVGGQQRLRISKILMGVGLNFSNKEIQSAKLTESIHSVSEELPSLNFSLIVLDKDNLFSVDDDNSFVNYLETGQRVSASVGLELDDGSIEWVEILNAPLADWKSTKGKMSFTAKDLLAFCDEAYTDGNRIHSRTLFADAEAVLTDLGLEPDEYEIDECLKDIAITNPLPELSHAECLQLIANAGRCILYQNTAGKICLKANFANVLDPDEMTVDAVGASEWSKPENILTGSNYVYADMTQNFFSLDGSMFFLPENGESYLETGFVSAEVADDFGLFQITPSITITLPAGYVYYGVIVNFDGNPPQEMVITTHRNGTLQDTVTYSDLEKRSVLNHEYRVFDQMTFTFTKASPNDRVLVNKISFGDLSDYTLKKRYMYDEPVAYREIRKKSVAVKIFSFENDEQGKPKEIEDNVHFAQPLNDTGEVIVFENQLIGTQEHAQLVAEWLGNYYANNVSYSISKFRGEPRLQAADIIHMENDYLPNLQIEISKRTFSFNGAFSGSIEARRALRMMEDK